MNRVVAILVVLVLAGTPIPWLVPAPAVAQEGTPESTTEPPPEEPSPTPTDEPISGPTEEPTATEEPTPEPTATETTVADATPTEEPAAAPTAAESPSPAATATPSPTPTAPEQPVTPVDVRGNHAAGQVLVQFVAGASSAEKSAAHRKVGVRRGEAIHRGPDGDLELLRLPKGTSVGEALARLQTDPVVRFVEPNWIYDVAATPDDPEFGVQWGLHNTGQSVNGRPSGVPDCDIDAPEAWNLTTGSTSVYVGVIDEGIDVSHQDLAGVVINPNEDANGDGIITGADFDGIDNDGNGYVDDVYGWDFDGKDNTVYDGRPGDNPYVQGTDGHGTFVAGVIGAVGNNAIGLTGVNWHVRLISAKFIDKNGGKLSDAVKAIDYFVDLRARGVNVVATNNSWGGTHYSKALQEAVERTSAAGILFVAVAGNGGSDGLGDDNDLTPFYPASYPSSNVISVAAITQYDDIGEFSNYGATSVDLGAPGQSIFSTFPGNSYGYNGGTSFAAPHVTGVIALLAAYSPELTAPQLKARVLATVVPMPALAGRTVSGGRLNAYRALTGDTGTDP